MAQSADFLLFYPLVHIQSGTTNKMLARWPGTVGTLSKAAPCARSCASSLLPRPYHRPAPSTRTRLAVQARPNGELAIAARELVRVALGAPKDAAATNAGDSSGQKVAAAAVATEQGGVVSNDLAKEIEDLTSELRSVRKVLFHQNALQSLQWVYQHLDEFEIEGEFIGIGPKGEGYYGHSREDILKLIIRSAIAGQWTTQLQGDMDLYDPYAKTMEYMNDINKQLARVLGMRGSCKLVNEVDGYFDFELWVDVQWRNEWRDEWMDD